MKIHGQRNGKKKTKKPKPNILWVLCCFNSNIFFDTIIVWTGTKTSQRIIIIIKKAISTFLLPPLTSAPLFSKRIWVTKTNNETSQTGREPFTQTFSPATKSYFTPHLCIILMPPHNFNRWLNGE